MSPAAWLFGNFPPSGPIWTSATASSGDFVSALSLSRPSSVQQRSARVDSMTHYDHPCIITTSERPHTSTSVESGRQRPPIVYVSSHTCAPNTRGNRTRITTHPEEDCSTCVVLPPACPSQANKLKVLASHHPLLMQHHDTRDATMQRWLDACRMWMYLSSPCFHLLEPQTCSSLLQQARSRGQP